jgi:hypothetical protein
MSNKFDNSFRKQANKLRIEPTSDTWHRLEKRMNKGRQNRISLKTSIMAVAAVFILLIAYIGFVQSNHSGIANSLPGFVVHDISMTENTDYSTALMSWVSKSSEVGHYYDKTEDEGQKIINLFPN